MRRDTGIDKELAKMDHSIRELTANADVLGNLEDPPELHAQRRWPKKPPASASAPATAGGANTPSTPAPTVPSEEAKREVAAPEPADGNAPS
jgi:hypothetical protein